MFNLLTFYMEIMHGVSIIRVRSLVDEVEELVELRSDDDLCTAVLLAAFGCVVGIHGVIFAAATAGEACGIDAEIVLESLYDA